MAERALTLSTLDGRRTAAGGSMEMDMFKSADCEARSHETGGYQGMRTVGADDLKARVMFCIAGVVDGRLTDDSLSQPGMAMYELATI